MQSRARGSALAALLMLAACSSTPPAADQTRDDALTDEDTGPRAGAVESHGDGPSCDEAIAAYESEHGPVGDEGALSPEDEEAMKDVLNRGSYLNSCEVASTASVDICAAIIEGGVVGVTVRVDPAFQNQVDCVASSIRRMEFPSHPQMTQARTSFEPSL